MKNILVQGEPKSGVSTHLRTLIKNETDVIRVVFDTYGDVIDHVGDIASPEGVHCIRTLFNGEAKESLANILNSADKDIVIIIDHAEFISGEKLKYIREATKDLSVNVTFVIAQCTGVHQNIVDKDITAQLRRTFGIEHEYVSLKTNNAYKLYKSKNFGESYKLVSDNLWWK